MTLSLISKDEWFRLELEANQLQCEQAPKQIIGANAMGLLKVHGSTSEVFDAAAFVERMKLLHRARHIELFRHLVRSLRNRVGCPFLQ